MKPLSVLVFTLCVFGASAQIPKGVGDMIKLFNECRRSEGISPCLKMKVLDLVDRVGRMEKINFFDGVILKANPEGKLNESTSEDEEKSLPRAVDAKDQALTTMIINRVARMIGSKTIEISMPRLIESARRGQGEKFDFGGGSGGGGKKEKKKKRKTAGRGIMYFIATLAAQKIAMIPLYIGALFFLAKKALISAKIALLIIGLISIQKFLASKRQAPAQVQHVSAGWSGGDGGGGWDSGWGRRSIELAQKMAFNGQKPT